MVGGWREKLSRWFAEEKEYGKERPNRRIGRIEERDRNVLPRVRHHYPRKDEPSKQKVVNQKGEIHTRTKPVWQRRPVLQKNTRQPELGDRQVSTGDREKLVYDPHEAPRQARRGRQGNHHSEVPKVREKFTGVDFRAADVPSPVYGFRKRRDLIGENTVNESVRVSPDAELLARVNVPEGESPDVKKTDDGMTGEDTSAQLPETKLDIPKTSVQSPETNMDFAGTSAQPSETQSDTIGANARIVDQAKKSLETKTQKDESDTLISGAYSQTKEQENDIHVTAQNNPYPFTEGESPQQDTSLVLSAQPELSAQKDTYEEKDDSQFQIKPARKPSNQLPSLQLLAPSPPPSDADEGWMNDQRGRLAETLEHFNVKAEVVGVTKGPAVTRFEVHPAPGVKVNKITKLSDDLKLSLAARDIRIEAPIPGKGTIGIEIPNPTSTPVSLREMIESETFQNSKSPLTAALGLDIAGTPIITDLQKMPHGLISGATGSGKSVCINSMLISLLYKATPEELKMILIDPKVVELAPFKDIPHLATPVINDPKEASRSLKWAVEEMERRYECLAAAESRDIARYNRRMNEQGKPEEKMPYIVIIIDELADLMMVSPQEVEDSICRIAQKARACGIHLVLATQRPSVDVITGLIKANIPTRIAFSVSSQADSRTILDKGGAEKLLGHGDMLFVENGAPQSVRVQGNFVSDEEIDRITDFARSQGDPDYLFEKETLQEAKSDHEGADELFEDAGFFVFEQGAASTSSLQRHFRIGYNRAARLIDSMEASGMISEAKGSKPRQLLMSEDEFLEQILKVEA